VRHSDAPGRLRRVVTNCRLRGRQTTLSAPAAERVRRVLLPRRGPARVATRCRSGGALRPRAEPPVRRARAVAPRGHELSAAAPPGDALCALGGARAACPAPSAARPARVATRRRPGGAVRVRHEPPVRRARAVAPRGHELSAAAPPGDAFCARGGARAACPALSARRPARVETDAPGRLRRGVMNCRLGHHQATLSAPSAGRPAGVATRCRSGGALRPRPGPPVRHARAIAPRGRELSAGAPSGDAFCARGGVRAACLAPSAWRPARVATRCRPGGAVRPRPVPPVRPDARGNVGGRG